MLFAERGVGGPPMLRIGLRTEITPGQRRQRPNHNAQDPLPQPAVTNFSHCHIRKTCEDPLRKQRFFLAFDACLFCYGASLMVEEGSFTSADSPRWMRVQARASVTIEAAN